MKRIILTLLLLIWVSLAFSQTKSSEEVKKDSYNNYDELREKQNKIGIELLTYLDSTFNFEVKVPNWLNLRETGSPYAWGGTLPAVDGIENAILVKSFNKSGYKSLAAFRKFIVDDLVFGQSPPWSPNHIVMGKKDLGEYKNIGHSFKVYLMQRKVMYYCEYIIMETKTAYLWIDFTSTQETFDKNVGKFDEFMNGFKTTNF